jgi:hypothetical protein
MATPATPKRSTSAIDRTRLSIDSRKINVAYVR